MPYQPGIPTGSVPLNQDYLNIQGNFSSLNSQFNVDHVPLTNTSGSPPNGYHTALHLVPQSSVTATPGYGNLYSQTNNDGISTSQQLFYQFVNSTPSTINVPLTRNFAPIVTGNGATFLPGGLILQYGKKTSPGNSGQITFPIEFPGGAPFMIQLTLLRDSGNQSLSVDNGSGVNPAPTSKKFGYLSSSAGSTAIYWMAIGI